MLFRSDVRPSYDVDAIAEISSYAAYADFSQRLRNLGFREDDTEGAPVCRWRQNKTILDVMPLDEKILGFSNRWYKPAMDSAKESELEPGLRMRVVTSVYFCATKLEAFRGRGKEGYGLSKDLEDLVAVIDGRAEIIEEIRRAPETVKAYIASEARKLLDTAEFMDALPGYLLPDAASQARIRPLLARFTQIAAL